MSRILTPPLPHHNETLAIFGYFHHRLLAYPDSTNDWAYRFWKVPLGESEREAIERFLKAGLLVHCTVPEQLDWGFTLAQLKGFLRERGLKLAGKKTEIADRLYQADPAGMGKACAVALREATERWIEWQHRVAMEKAGTAAVRKAGAECILLKCSETGLRLVSEYTAIEREMGRRALDALRNEDFASAISTVLAFEDKLGFPASPMMSPEDARKFVCQSIPLAFAAKPKILSAVSEDVMRCLRFTAAASELCVLCRGCGEAKCFAPDTDLIKSLKTGLDMENQAALRMVIFHVNFQYKKETWKQMGVRRVQLRAIHHPDEMRVPCQTCMELDGREWPIDEVPDLPYQHCTSKFGCRCFAMPMSIPISRPG